MRPVRGERKTKGQQPRKKHRIHTETGAEDRRESRAVHDLRLRLCLHSHELSFKPGFFHNGAGVRGGGGTCSHAARPVPGRAAAGLQITQSGGAAVHEGTRANLAHSKVPVVYLKVSYAEAMRRVGGDQDRPMLARPDVAQVYAERDPRYAQAATVTVDADDKTPEELVLGILACLQ